MATYSAEQLAAMTDVFVVVGIMAALLVVLELIAAAGIDER